MKRIAILGAAESGIGTAILAQKEGWDVFVSDMGTIKDKYKQQLDVHHILWEEGGHTEALILNADRVVKSPGIPDTAPIVQKLIGQGTPILSELEFAQPYSRGKSICITGSNGKTTTTSLIYYIMQRSGADVGLAGNIGRSYALQVAEGDHDWYVLEISSFQLDNMFQFRADVAVLMNITPDHLDRYGFEMQNYTDSKMRIIQNQTQTDAFVYWRQDEHIEAELQKRREGYAPKPTPSSRPAQPGNPSLLPFEDEDFERLGLQFSQMGQHNKRNALAAYSATKQVGVDETLIRQCLMEFPGVEHRLERVEENVSDLSNQVTQVSAAVDENTAAVDYNTAAVEENTAAVENNTAAVEENTAVVEDNTAAAADQFPQCLICLIILHIRMSINLHMIRESLLQNIFRLEEIIDTSGHLIIFRKITYTHDINTLRFIPEVEDET